MPAYKSSPYRAYSMATLTVAKTRQIVMLYDGAIRFLRQAQSAIAENRIEERFRLLSRASDVVVGLQNSIDFDNGGEIAHTLHRFYVNISTRILSVNFQRGEGEALCEAIIDELKQMRDVWDTIDRGMESKSPLEAAPAPVQTASALASANVTFSA